MELEARPRRHRSLTKPWDSRDAYAQPRSSSFCAAAARGSAVKA